MAASSNVVITTNQTPKKVNGIHQMNSPRQANGPESKK